MASSWQVSSFSETKAQQILQQKPAQYLRFNQHQLSRIYPSSYRVDSSNYNPQPFWNAGCQMGGFPGAVRLPAGMMRRARPSAPQRPCLVLSPVASENLCQLPQAGPGVGSLGAQGRVGSGRWSACELLSVRGGPAAWAPGDVPPRRMAPVVHSCESRASAGLPGSCAGSAGTDRPPHVLPAVALNYQSEGRMLQLNRAKFSANGSCGYVLKPQCMCQGEAPGNKGCGLGCTRIAGGHLQVTLGCSERPLLCHESGGVT